MLSRKSPLLLAVGILVIYVNTEIVNSTNVRSNIWHDGPINCYTCDSEDECALGNGVIQKCENNDDQTCVIVFSEKGIVNQRGCSDKIISSQNGSYCSKNPDRCPTCSSSACNEATSMDGFIECVACDSSLDKNCALNPADIIARTLCFGNCMTALYPTSKTDNPSYSLVRSCLNDRDIDDQKACLNGNDRMCHTCNQPHCNVNIMPEVRHSCYRCSGDDCEDPVREECPKYKEDDHCFMRFEEGNNDAIELGCLSDFDSEEAVIDLVKQKALYICDGMNCNGFEHLPKTFECSNCSSVNAEACATNPAAITAPKKCITMPYTQCYQRINGIATERGCLSDLVGDEFYNCLIGSDDKCQICEGNNCNEEIIPEDRLRCHRCNSNSDAACHTSPATSSVCPSYSDNDACVASYENGVTKRGCRSEFTCVEDSKGCEICVGNNCNTANLMKRVEEIYGVFQDLPLNCNTCVGDECKTGVRNPRKCEGDPYQDCMTIFNIKGEVIRRGCENLVLEEYLSHCNDNPDLCFNCKSNGCNDMTDPFTNQLCLYCDASNNSQCLFNPDAVTSTRKCTLGCISSLYPRKSNPKVYDFVRTCLEDIEPDNRESCTEENNCLVCSDEKCNTAILPETGRLSCNHCEGNNCNAQVSKPCEGYAADDQCYMYFDNVTHSVVKMGCRSELTITDILADIKQYFICDGDNCNEYDKLPEARFCYACNSENDVRCATDPSQVTTKDRCQNYPYTECYTRIRDDGHTERGCIYNLPTEIFVACNTGDPDSNCRICAENECNKNIYPSSRQQCHRCNSLIDVNCEGEPNSVQPCPLFVKNDACVTQWVDGVTRRDCATELNCDGLNRKNCRQCSEFGCNDINLANEDIGKVGVFADLPLTCYHCNGTEECQQSIGNLNVCTNNIHQTCTVVFNTEGNVIQRGCSDIVDHVCTEAGNVCYDCKSTGCNTAKKELDYINCIFCDSQSDVECTFNANNITRTRKCQGGCMTALYPRTKDDVPVYELMRTCLDDKNLDDRLSCEAKEDPQCKSCSEENCNKDQVGLHKSCYQCIGNECQNAQAQLCRSVMNNDQCFVQFDESGSVIELGCKSKYDPSEVVTLVTAKLLWLCDDDNCNHIDNLPQSQSCTLCNSLSDTECSTNPEHVVSYTTCNSLPYSHCYSRILQSGHTERGCLSNLENEEFYNCLYNKNDVECLSCVGDKCNNMIYPNGRTTCHICSSADSTTCETMPDSSEVCLRYIPNDSCVTIIDDNGFTVRGCSSQIPCDESDPTNCQKCDGNDCNTVNLMRKSDAKPGVWQNLPLTCLTCSNVDECKTGYSQEICNGKEHCMTVFNNNGEVIKRGCSGSVEEEQGPYCDVNHENCFNCNSNLCNNATSLFEYNDCIYCDSESNNKCALNPEVVARRRKCNGACMTALYPIANSSVYGVVRSCLDDKDISDQDVCASGLDSECKSCSGSACNVEIIPESRLSCYACIGENCVDANVGYCPKYKPKDQCFILFDDKSDVVQMGCVSDLDDSFVSNNIHRLYTCNSNNCNGYENIPKTTMCAECNSNDDPDCALMPQNVPSITQCTSRPNTQCYTKINNDGSTERGCVTSLSYSDMISCLSGNYNKCSTCESDRCNIQVFPPDRRRCHRCNTKDDPECESLPDSASVCPIYDSDQFCTTKLVNGHTYRGCSTEFQCNDDDKQYCRQCFESDNCNVVDLASSNIGYPGKWQGVPINCYSCEGWECQTLSLGVIGKCENNNKQNCATVFAANGTVIQRGCSDVIYNSERLSYCDKNPSLCKFCKSSGCNTAISINDYVDCIFCDGSVDSDCIFYPETKTHTRSCHKNCMTALYPRTNEDNPAYELSRSCLDDLDLDDREQCQSGIRANCKSCSEDKCNNVIVPETRLKCNVCHGNECEEYISAQCTSYRENDKCFTLFDEESNIQGMGCASDLDNSFISSNRRNLLLCEGDNCNDVLNLPQPPSCRWCSSDNDPDCASSPSTTTATVCHLYPNTECYMAVDEDGVTRRGCLSDVDEELFNDCTSGVSTKCKICSSNDCNSAIFPEERRSCIQCDSSLFSACEDNAIQFAQTCVLYRENDSCVTKLEGDRTLRGCASDFTCDTSSRETCRICNATDNCNTVNLLGLSVGTPGKWQGLPLNCYACEGLECADGNGIINVCEGNNLQTCTTVFGLNGSVEKRGCSDTISISHGDFCDQYPDRCLNCKSNGCNTGNSLDDFTDCYFCDSALDANCSTAFDEKKIRTRKCHGDCMVALYPRSSSSDPAYELARTCLDDLDLDDRDACSNDQKQFCKACSGSRCNTMSFPEDRFECYTCLDNDCEDMDIKQCNAYHPNDQCYILFNEENSIISMGCRSEFEAEVVTELLKQKKMLLCNEKGCNSPHSIPSPKYCSVCSSENNSLCATNPNLVGNMERCSSLPYTECVTRVNNYGHTERGCLGSLQNDIFFGCLMGTDNLCETCVGDKCNEIDIYPTNRRKCQQCSSAIDPLCASSPDNNKVCPLYDENDSCVTNFRNGITTRGCSSTMKCDDPENKRTCRTCDTDGCNTVNLERNSENGEPGRWQDLPITCYSCKGEEECFSKGDFRSCLNNPFQNCMTVFSNDGKVIQRGCSDVVEEDQGSYCEANPGNCMACNSNGCNVANSLDEYIECLVCDTDSGPDCSNNIGSIEKTRKCYKYCMSALYPLYQEANPSYGLVRSCYDDMDIDDRDSCAAGNKDYCQVCETEKCNTIDMPQTRYSCYICEGDSCQDPKIQQCPTYRPDDKCYVLFDEKQSIVALGCRSEFSNEDADNLLKQKRLHICEGPTCNHINSLPTAHVCNLCNSRTDKNCAVNPSEITGYTTCAALPFTECYSRVLPDGETERGCLSNLYDEEFMTCLDGTSKVCEKCIGDKCNSKIFPEDRLKCHICDSSIDPSCENAPDNLGLCPLHNNDDTCVTVFRNGFTYRGCSSSLVCDATNPRKCIKCSGEGCNTINLAKKQDDNYGKWQDLPLTCLECTGSECNSSETTKSLFCDLNNEQDCMTVFDNSGKVVRRGCADIVESEYGTYCDANEDKCLSCKSNECNSAKSQSEFTECIYCDSNKNLDCIFKPLSPDHKVRKCQDGCMTALYPSDSSHNPSYDLIRTCLNDKELSDQLECSSGNDATCKACTGEKCNVDNVPEKRFTCYTCEGENCVEPVIQLCPLYKEFDQCFIKFDNTNSISEMGCVSSFRNQPLENIIKTKRVSVCNGPNCNSLDTISKAQKCAICDSGEDISCAVNPVEIASFKSCNMLPYTGCFSILTESGHTERGCLADLPDDEFTACVLGNDENCGVCSGDGCNRDIFPVNRQQCFTCTSEEESNCESFPTSKSPCPIVSESESCITALKGNVTVRGCSSNLYCDSGDSSTCRSCFSSECNSIDLVNQVDDGYHGVWQSLPLRCFTCEGQQCLNSLGSTKTCSSRNYNQDCMTVFKSNGEVDRRGCSDDVEDYRDLYCRQNPDLCFKCKSNECNVAWSIEDYVECAFCDSFKDSLCTINPSGSGFASRKCYKKCMVAMLDQRVIRSCLDDKELRVQNECNESENSECVSCSNANCNKFVFPLDRLKCHTCTGTSCTSSTGQYCEIYSKQDYCFAKYESGKVDLLGCASAQNASDLAQWEAQNKLHKCEGLECNELSRLPTESECLVCDSSKTPSCSQNPTHINTTQTCLAPKSQCMTHINSDGHTIRGCLSSLSEDEQSCVAAGTCVVCSGSKCNNEIFPTNRRSCHICNSVADKDCISNPNNPLICPIYVVNDSCVSTLSDDGIVTRGCASQVTCEKDDSDYCESCNSNNCNTGELKGSGSLVTQSLPLTLLLAVVPLIVNRK